MADSPLGREEYIQKVLTAYRQTPETTGTIRPPDRRVAAQLYARGVPLHTVENALLLAASRRLSPPLPLHRGSAPRHDSLPGLLSPRHQRGARTHRQPRLLPIPPPPNRGLSCRRLQPTDQPLTAQLPSLAFHAFGVG